MSTRARILLQLGRISDSEQDFRLATETGEALFSLDPDNTFIISELGKNYLAFSRVLVSLRQGDEAWSLMQEAEELAQQLLELNAEVQEWRDFYQEIQESKQALFGDAEPGC